MLSEIQKNISCFEAGISGTDSLGRVKKGAVDFQIGNGCFLCLLAIRVTVREKKDEGDHNERISIINEF